MRSRVSKIKSPQALKRTLSRLRAERVVFTNGCFDILHKGHVAYLEQARKLGTHLVVALNSDASVKRLKGPGRPVNPLVDRLEVLAALECVDYVTWFGEDDPLRIVLTLRPDILVKGGDWPIEKMIGANEVLGWGGKVKSLGYIPSRSTTALISKIKNSRG